MEFSEGDRSSDGTGMKLWQFWLGGEEVCSQPAGWWLLASQNPPQKWNSRFFFYFFFFIFFYLCSPFWESEWSSGKPWEIKVWHSKHSSEALLCKLTLENLFCQSLWTLCFSNMVTSS